MFLSGLNPDLARAAACVFLFGLWVSSRHLHWRWALLVVAIKVAIPFAYFAHDPFGVVHLDDDLGYYYAAIALQQRGLDAASLAAHPVLFRIFLEAMGGIHMAYPLWNLAAVLAFGPHYFAPVFLNVALTFVAAWLFARMLGNMGFSRGYVQWGFAFFLLHWDVVAWSSFLNLKDTLALTLTLAAVERLQALMQEVRPGRLLAVACLLGMLVFVRFYAPALILSAAALHLAVPGRGRARLTAALAVGAGLVAFGWWKSGLVVHTLSQVDPAGMAYGALRFAVTPLPWNLAPGYGFLLVSSSLHLLLLGPALMAAYVLWKRPGARFLFAYLAVTILLYAALPGLQGTRQRVQAAFVFAWLQFHALGMLLRRAARLTS